MENKLKLPKRITSKDLSIYILKQKTKELKKLNKISDSYINHINQAQKINDYIKELVLAQEVQKLKLKIAVEREKDNLKIKRKRRKKYYYKRKIKLKKIDNIVLNNKYGIIY